MSAKWPGSVATDADLYVAKNALATTLASTITNSDTTIPLTNTTNFPTAGGVTIDQEVIFYTGISGRDLTGCTRGADGTTIATHTAGVPVSATIIAFHHNGLMAEIEAIESWLTTNVVANPLLGNLAAGGYKVTGLAAGSTAGDSLRYEQVIGQFLLLSGGTLTGTLRLPDSGTFAAPQLQIGAANNGIYTGVANRLGLTCGGVENTVWGPTFCSLSSPIQLQLQKTSNQIVFDHLTGGDTTITVPAAASARIYTIPDTGVDTSFLMASGGTLTGALLFPSGSASAPSFSFAGDQNTGIFSGGADQILFSTGGTNRMTLSSTDLDIKIPLKATGTTTNDSANAGYIGEVISSSVSAQNIPASAQYFDIASLTLTAGDWDVIGMVNYFSNSASWTSPTFEAGIGTASGNNSAGLVVGSNHLQNSNFVGSGFNHFSMVIPLTRISISVTATYYFKGYTATWTGGPPRVYARMTARRVR